ncbi:hypothetical protein [Levilactobacillus sp. HBUAS70063]|uniref:hypothetical protein n=1 Tax=Levilactobacillus sp. HBUAS70063 TaxID=3109359 RepID=UPI0031330EF7
MGPVIYTAMSQTQTKLTAADNPTVAANEADDEDHQAGLAEFKRLVMRDGNHGVVDQSLVLKTIQARDELVRLYGATGYMFSSRSTSITSSWNRSS